MMSVNVRPSSYFKPLAYLAPASISAATHFTAFVDTKGYEKLAILLILGTQAGGKLEMRQSSASAGTNPAALALVDGAEYDFVDADDNKQILVDIAARAAGDAGRYVDVTITPTSAGVIGAILFGVIPNNATAPSPSTV